MKRILFAVLIFLSMNSIANAGVVSVDAFISADDVTIPHLEQFRTRVVDAINNADGANIQAGSIDHTKLNAGADPVQRWGEAFNDWVYTGLLPTTTTGTLTSTTSAGTAYVKGYRVVKDATNHNYNASVWTFVDLSNNGTYTYPEVSIGATEPTTTTNSIRLARVVTDGTQITAVRDDRVLSINLGNTSAQEDFQVKDFLLYWGGSFTMTVDAGILYNGTTRIAKASQTALDISSNGDYVSGVSQRATSTWLYVYVSPTAQVKVASNAPNYHDTAGDTAGILYYYKSGSTYWRCIGYVRLNATGSGNLIPFDQEGNWIQFQDIIGEANLEVKSAGNDTSFTAVDCSGAVPAGCIYAEFQAQLNNGNVHILSLRPTGGSWITNGRQLMLDASGSIHSIKCSVNSARSVDYKIAADSVNLYVSGFEMRVRD